MISRSDLAILWSHSVFLRFFETIPCCNSNKFTFSSVEQVITWVTWLLWRNWKVKGGRGINCLHLFQIFVSKNKKRIEFWIFIFHCVKSASIFSDVIEMSWIAALISTRTLKLVYHFKSNRDKTACMILWWWDLKWAYGNGLGMKGKDIIEVWGKNPRPR